jgi:hypothetical protein
MIEGLLPKDHKVNVLMHDWQLLQVVQDKILSSIFLVRGMVVPLLLTMSQGVVQTGKHFVLVTDVDVRAKSLVVHDSLCSDGGYGTYFKRGMQSLHWTVHWCHLGTQQDGNSCGFRVAMMALQYTCAKKLTGEVPRWFVLECMALIRGQLNGYKTCNVALRHNTGHLVIGHYDAWLYPPTDPVASIKKVLQRTPRVHETTDGNAIDLCQMSMPDIERFSRQLEQEVLREKDVSLRVRHATVARRLLGVGPHCNGWAAYIRLSAELQRQGGQLASRRWALLLKAYKHVV